MACVSIYKSKELTPQPIKMSPLAAALLATSAAALAVAAPNPVPNPAAVVTAGSARFTILSERTVRMEYSMSATPSFDDNATYVILNRNTSVVDFKVTQLNATAVQIATSMLTIVYDGGQQPANESCAVQNGVDQHKGGRSPNYPNGAVVTDVGACCDLCSADLACNAFVFVPQSSAGAINCYLLQTPGETYNATNRQFGTLSGSRGFTPSNLRISASLPDGTSFTWLPGQAQTSNLNGTFQSLDCYSTPDECYTQGWQAMRTGLLARDGWTLLDDTASVRLTPASTSTADVPWWRPPASAYTDWYFFAYGGDFRGALAEYAALAGTIALMPRTAFGVWWSRYFNYSVVTLTDEVLSGYAANAVPLNNVVMDMVSTVYACSPSYRFATVLSLRRSRSQDGAMAHCVCHYALPTVAAMACRTGMRSRRTQLAAAGETGTSTGR